jgi:hypothetical protein
MADTLLVGSSVEGTYSLAPNYFGMGRFQAAYSKTGVTKFKMYCTASGNAKVGIYSDNAGAPNARLGYNNTAQAVVSGENDLTISSMDVVSGNYYWVAMNFDTDGVGKSVSGSGTLKYKSATYSTFTFPDPAGTGFSNGSYLLSAGLWGLLTIDLSGTLSSTSNSTMTLVKMRGYSSILNSTLNILSSLVKTRGLNGVLLSISNLICTLITEAIIELTALLPSVSNISAQAVRLRAITTALQNTSNIIDTLARSRSISVTVDNTVNIIGTLLTDLFVELSVIIPSESNINTGLQRLLILLADTLTAETQNVYGFIHTELVMGEINITDIIQGFINSEIINGNINLEDIPIHGFINSEYYRGDIYAS